MSYIKRGLNIKKFLIIPAILFLFYSIITFFISWKWDWEIQSYVGKMNYSVFEKIFENFYDVFGIFPLLVVIFILLAVIWESFIFYSKNNAKNNIIRNNRWISYLFYIFT
ncbi:hypothetical protein STAIW_v1c04730 [Spiroplasma taiwanense CT-1]|uniref:Transmembrane protein n=2 Tax=Spiroplasma taiwanense TaxID=2145 RepID=S5LWV5_9MOLU|nr:hypothetical protein STAIW_v1c04730 [Spiroplasma taiwanense CT-1]